MAGYLNLPPYSFRDGKEFLPASLLFALHATLSLFALHGMNIPMYGAIKRCTPLVSLILSVVVLRKSIPSKKIVLSILLITFGCLIASIGDLGADHVILTGRRMTNLVLNFECLFSVDIEIRSGTIQVLRQQRSGWVGSEKGNFC